MNEESFFKDFDAHRWDFTIVDEDDEEKPVLQVGLVAIFYLVDAYLPVRRKHIAQGLNSIARISVKNWCGVIRGERSWLREPSPRKTSRTVFRIYSQMDYQSQLHLCGHPTRGLKKSARICLMFARLQGGTKKFMAR